MTDALQTLGKYHLLRKIGVGGMAEVFLARAEGPGGFEKLVVVKRILSHLAEDPSFVTMFLAEARLAARLDHPNVVQVFDFGEVEGTFFLVMEFVDGPNLRSLMRRTVDAGEAVPVGVAGRLVSGACEGLAYAHELVDAASGEPLSIVHRDVSPDNLLVSRSGVVKVVDFGIAKAADRASLTRTGAVKGKLAYMAPEQLRGEPLDRRTDVFALGMVLNELLLGHKALDVSNEAAVIRGLLYERIPLASERRADVRPGLGEILERALAKDPSLRYPDCRAFQAELDGFLAGEEPPPSSALIGAFVQRFTQSQVPPSRPSAPSRQGASLGGAGPAAPGAAPPVPSHDSGLATAPRAPETHEGRSLPVEVELSLSGLGPGGTQALAAARAGATAVLPAGGAASGSGAAGAPPDGAAPSLGAGASGHAGLGSVPQTVGPSPRLGARSAAVAMAVLLLAGGIALFRSSSDGTQGGVQPPPAPSDAGAMGGRAAATATPDAAAPTAAAASSAIASGVETGERGLDAGVPGEGAADAADAATRPSARPPVRRAADRRAAPGVGTSAGAASSQGGQGDAAAGAGGGEATAPAAAPEYGLVDFRVRPFGVVWVDGRLLGETPFAPVRLPVGVHSVKVLNRELAKEVQTTFEVRAGDNSFKLNLEAPPPAAR